jgi:hypothetical protein
MVAWTLDRKPDQLVDPGCGSGRFCSEALRRAPDIQVVAIDLDPLATLACRALLATLGVGSARVINADYTRLDLGLQSGRTAFIGNPPYIRHHNLGAEQKRIAKSLGKALGVSISGLAGLHTHFLLATLKYARLGDIGCFLTSAEWLDVGYGQAVRTLLLDRTTQFDLHLVDPAVSTFEEVMTTALVLGFQTGSPQASVRVRTVNSAVSLGNLDQGGRFLSRSRLAKSTHWRALVNGVRRTTAHKTIRLGEICRVSRGEVTGANRFFVMGAAEAERCGVEKYTVPVLCSAREVLQAKGVVHMDSMKRVLLAPSATLDLRSKEHESLFRYLKAGERLGFSRRYICQHREPWWHLALKRPPIVATYMARQPPAFALNPDGIAIINVLHGLYPLVDMSLDELQDLVSRLNRDRDQLRGKGRVYHGGLEKFEPSEMEAVQVRPPSRRHQNFQL